MILSDREIQAAVARGALKITPLPAPESWSSTAVDLRLAKELAIWKRIDGHGVEAVVCPARADYNFNEVRNRHSEQKNRSKREMAFHLSEDQILPLLHPNG